MSKYLKTLCDYQERQIRGLQIALDFRTNNERKLIRELEYLRCQYNDTECVDKCIRLAKEILK